MENRRRKQKKGKEASGLLYHQNKQECINMQKIKTDKILEILV